MTYAATEESTYSGSPVELYLFDRAGVSFWAYTSADTAQTYGGNTYAAIPIQRSDIEQSQDVARASLSINLPSSASLLEQFISSPPTDIINLTLYRFHEGEGSVVSAWLGRITNVEFNGYEAEVYCESVQTSIRRPTGRRLYQVNCPHVLYGDQCGVTQSTYKTTATLSAVSGLVVTSSSFGLQVDGYYTGGIVEFVDSGLTTLRFVTDHVGNNLTLNLTLTGAYVGASVNAYPGCDRSTDHCNDKFSNLVNYGGQPFYPDKNPFRTNVF